MDIKLTGLSVATVAHGTSAGDFLPFTTLPQSYHGRRVVLVPLTAAMEEEIKTKDTKAIDLFDLL
jgi:hypothetical protein